MNLEKLIYKQDMENNTMRISKTKVITILVFIIFFIWPLYDFLFDPKYSYTGIGSSVLAAIIVALIVSVPTFIIGFVIGKILEKRNKSSKTIDTSPANIPSQNIAGIDSIQSNVEAIKTDNANPNPKLLKINELKNEFDEKELATKELIKTKFEPPQVTYNRFIAVVDNCSKIFNEQYTSALNLINITNNSSQKVDEEINSKIDIMQSLIDKLTDLSNELVINISKTKDDDIDHVLNDMENLISSINDFKD